MATWGRFSAEAGELAARAAALLQRHGLAYLATVRRDGSPRLHPVVPVMAIDRITVAIPHASPKWRDFVREPRCALHALPGRQDDELAIRALAAPAEEHRAAIVAAAGHQVHDDDHLFELDLLQVDVGWWERVGQPDTSAVRHRWTPGTVVQVKP